MYQTKVSLRIIKLSEWQQITNTTINTLTAETKTFTACRVQNFTSCHLGVLSSPICSSFLYLLWWNVCRRRDRMCFTSFTTSCSANASCPCFKTYFRLLWVALRLLLEQKIWKEKIRFDFVLYLMMEVKSCQFTNNLTRRGHIQWVCLYFFSTHVWCNCRHLYRCSDIVVWLDSCWLDNLWKDTDI